MHQVDASLPGYIPKLLLLTRVETLDPRLEQGANRSRGTGIGQGSFAGKSVLHKLLKFAKDFLFQMLRHYQNEGYRDHHATDCDPRFVW